MKNVIELIYKMAQQNPFCRATNTHTYQSFINEVNLLRGQYVQKTILILERPSEKLLIKLVALMADGNTLVFIDPSLKAQTIRDSLVKLPITHVLLETKLLWLQLVIPKLFLFKKILFSKPLDSVDETPISFEPESACFYSLTTGSTGPVKIVPIPHQTLLARQSLAHKYLPPASPDCHLAGYMLSQLQNLTEGATCLFGPIETWIDQATRLSGPPGPIVEFVEKAFVDQRTYPGLQNILFGGAPIPQWLINKCKTVFPNASGLIIYGSTESEPISRIDYDQAIQLTYPGYAVGAKVDELEIRIHNLAQQIYYPFRDYQQLGELWIAGPQVIKKYFDSDLEEKSVKIPEGEKVWHRTGDLVLQDRKGDLFLLGRTKDLIPYQDRFYPNLALEADLENTLGLRRIALFGQQNKLMAFVECFGGQSLTDHELQDRLSDFYKRWDLAPICFHFRKSLPVDRRHRWKIHRQELNKLA